MYFKKDGLYGIHRRIKKVFLAGVGAVASTAEKRKRTDR